MNSVVIGVLAFIAIFGGALGGGWIARRLPKQHLSDETRTAVSISMAVVGTLSALVLGLLISTANSSYSAKTDAVGKLGINIIKLDRALILYGPEAADIRAALKTYTAAKTKQLSGENPSSSADIDTLRLLESIVDQILGLHPANESQHQFQARAVSLADAISDERWFLAENLSVALPTPFLILLIFWLALLFASFGLFAPHNATIVVVLLLCAVAISGGIVMVLELGAPNGTLIRPSLASMNFAIRELAAN